MPGLTIWKDQEIIRLKRDMDRLIARLRHDFGIPPSPGTVKAVPTIHLSETEDALIVRAEITGVNPEDIELSITEDRLTIKGERKQEFVDKSENYHRIGTTYGSFSRTVRLPCRVVIEDVKATCEKGVLDIVMPKYKLRRARVLKIKVN